MDETQGPYAKSMLISQSQKDQQWYYSAYMIFLKESHSQSQNLEGWLPGDGDSEGRERLFTGFSISSIR